VLLNIFNVFLINRLLLNFSKNSPKNQDGVRFDISIQKSIERGKFYFRKIYICNVIYGSFEKIEMREFPSIYNFSNIRKKLNVQNNKNFKIL
jgi:hypothetical protein